MDNKIKNSQKSIPELLEKVANETAEGITISDMSLPDSPLIYLNEGFERLTGYSRAESLGKNCRFLQGERTNPQAVQKIRRAIDSGQSCTVELLNYRKNGTPFWNRLSISPLKDKQNRITHYVGVQSDITELKITKERLEKANQDLRLFHKKITRELDQARMAQQFLLPAKLPASETIRFYAKFVPMSEIGGDFYDVLTLEKGVYGILIADVTGHGIPAALITFMSSTTFKNIAPEYTSTVEVIGETNKRLYNKMPDDAFLSMFYAVYHSKEQKLIFSQAGHPPGLILRSENREIIPLTSDGTLVGAFSPQEVTYQEKYIDLIPGDKLILYTDAILEAKRPDYDMLGMDRLTYFLEDQWDVPLEKLLENMYKFGLEFSGRASYDDDFTLLAMEVLR